MSILHIKNRFSVTSITILLYLFCATAYAETLKSQRAVFSETIKSQEYRLTLSGLRKINAVHRSEREVLIRGEIQRETIEFNSGVSVSEAWVMLASSYLNNAYLELFSCLSLACGSSNAWANERFGIKQLYGMEQKQRYYALRSKLDPSVYVALYFVERGNHRIYAQIDTIKTLGAPVSISPSYSSIMNQIQTQGFYSISIDDDQKYINEELNAVAKALHSKPFLEFYIVGHAYSAKKLDENKRIAEQHVVAVVDALLLQGVKENRLEKHALGNLSPVNALPRDRVELVLKR